MLRALVVPVAVPVLAVGGELDLFYLYKVLEKVVVATMALYYPHTFPRLARDWPCLPLRMHLFGLSLYLK